MLQALLTHIKDRRCPREQRDSFALEKLDIKLEPYLRRRGGFFIEAGANNGISYSNTLYFEKYLGWHGLLIEAVPSLSEDCQKNRPRCLVEHCALVAAEYPQHTIEIQYCNLMSIVPGALGDAEEERKHIQDGLQFLKSHEKVYTTRVPAQTLSAIIDKHQIEHIDLLSLDVEGYEAQALKGIDFDRHRPEFMLIEVRRKPEIEAVIGKYYTVVAVLQANEAYADILYRRL
ncbi:MAG: FkbM family methyltransferase [Verrucomicrobia bacterium]|nr:MAG: FkbM family methyltransferase [Verrucomicrobiota bacterium]